MIMFQKSIWKSKDGKTYSTKPTNIRINLEFLLSNAFRLKTVFSVKDIWLVLAVLLAIFRLQEADKGRILEYAKSILPQDSKLTLDIEEVEECLNILEELRCIKLEDGKYSVVETVNSSFYGWE